MTRGSPTITIHLPESLRASLTVEAHKSGQTITQFVQAALRASLPADGSPLRAENMPSSPNGIPHDLP